MTRQKLADKMFAIVTDLQRVTEPSKIHLALTAAGELHELARRISPEHGNEAVECMGERIHGLTERERRLILDLIEWASKSAYIYGFAETASETVDDEAMAEVDREVESIKAKLRVE